MSYLELDVFRRLSAHRQEIKDLDLDRSHVVADRDALIRGAHAEGVTIATLARATGLTRTMIYKIIERDPAH